MRISEFLQLNQKMYVVGLREGTLFRIENEHIELKGNRPCRIFKYNHPATKKYPGDIFDFLMQ
jgi:dipeptidase E